MPHLRYPPLRPHPPIRLLPSRQLRLRLAPMRHRSLIAPVQQKRHRLLMRAAGPVRVHTLLALPRRHRPERPPAVGQQRSPLKAWRRPDLIPSHEHLPRKPRQEPNRPDPQARQAHKHHGCSPYRLYRSAQPAHRPPLCHSLHLHLKLARHHPILQLVRPPKECCLNCQYKGSRE